MTKIANIFENMDSLCCRSFDVKETLALLYHPNPSVAWSWGIEQKVNYNDLGLLLKVNAHRHTGWLLISLSFMDLYDVHLFEDGKIKQSIKGLYFDQLRDSIDEVIEKIDEYEF